MEAVLSASDAEVIIESLQCFPLRDVGNTKWLNQHDGMEKLNMQAHVSVTMQSDEFVMEELITSSKFPLLVHELLVIELWKRRILPLLMKRDEFASGCTMRPYMVLYHEATIMGLLEVVLFHQDACEALGDSALDLADYCYRRLVQLNETGDEDASASAPMIADKEALLAETTKSQLERQHRSLRFSIAVQTMSVLRYLTDHMSHLPLSLSTRLLNTNDSIIALVPLVQRPPWTRINDKGTLTKYSDSKWSLVEPEDRLKLSKCEAQIWLTLYNLLMDDECRRKYEFTSHNKEVVLRLRGHFNELLLDQIPMLSDLQRSLETLALMNTPEVTPVLHIEQVPEIREALLRTNKNHWKEISDFQMKTVFTLSQSDMMAEAKRLAETYNMDLLEQVVDLPKCARCGQSATKRCSRCKGDWYCGRECQVKAWSTHKASCDMVASQ